MWRVGLCVCVCVCTDLYLSVSQQVFPLIVIAVDANVANFIVTERGVLNHFSSYQWPHREEEGHSNIHQSDKLDW